MYLLYQLFGWFCISTVALGGRSEGFLSWPTSPNQVRNQGKLIRDLAYPTFSHSGRWNTPPGLVSTPLRGKQKFHHKITRCFFSSNRWRAPLHPLSGSPGMEDVLGILKEKRPSTQNHKFLKICFMALPTTGLEWTDWHIWFLHLWCWDFARFIKAHLRLVATARLKYAVGCST